MSKSEKLEKTKIPEITGISFNINTREQILEDCKKYASSNKNESKQKEIMKNIKNFPTTKDLLIETSPNNELSNKIRNLLKSEIRKIKKTKLL